MQTLCQLFANDSATATKLSADANNGLIHDVLAPYVFSMDILYHSFFEKKTKKFLPKKIQEEFHIQKVIF
jgi:hypothetical protein